MAVAGGCRIGCLGARDGVGDELALQVRIARIVAGGEDNTPRGPHHVRLGILAQVLDTRHHAAFDQQAARTRARTDAHAGSPRPPLEVIDVSAGIGEHDVHAGPAVRGFVQRAQEYQAGTFQPAYGVGHVFCQQPAELLVVGTPDRPRE